MEDFEKKRQFMTDTVRAYGIRDESVLEAMRIVPRHLFVRPEMQDLSYENIALPVDFEQTISQPYTVGHMLEMLELKKGQNVLEIGSGSGYNAALIAYIIGKAGKVTSVELIYELTQIAIKNIAAARSELKKQKIELAKTEIVCDDGSLGYPKNKPYDRVIITAATPTVPDNIFKQLKDGGIVIAPVGTPSSCRMVKAVKIKGKIHRTAGKENFGFVPLRGEHGYRKY
ncbi:protein-L-isoaspartate(D-aspartate) O-methyltransferase [Candidatus Woesearchaeota archaeon]|nr:protein-L-isoaspartate(D-aspartate) O-methyltransferase [Candidatus Woesearchaeota archaeon]